MQFSSSVQHPRCAGAGISGTPAKPAAAPALIQRPWRRLQRRQPSAAAAAQTRLLEPETATSQGEEDMAQDMSHHVGLAPAQCGDQPRSGGALSLAGTPGREQEVPRTLPHALATFFSHPSALIIVTGLLALLYLRAQQPLHPGADAAVAAAVATGWCLQEWLVHKLLLHSSFDWMGRRIHEGHHARPYFHVSIDDPPLVLAFMAGSLAIFYLGSGGSELGLTAAAAYYSMGLLYEYTHFIVHTRVLPRSRAGKAIRMHHLLHHTRSEEAWLAFTVPQVDALFGTAPNPRTVRMTPMARASLKSKAGRAS